MAEPLFRLAEQGSLPDHQVMDVETLRWIAAGVLEEWKAWDREQIRTVCREGFPFPGTVEDLFPSLEMFQVPALYESIHGTRHAARVGLFCHWVAGVCDVPLNLLKTAALFHDVRRVVDGDDPGHGERAARYYLDRIEGPASPADQTAAVMMRYHEVDYDQIPATDLGRYALEIDAFKAADGLDRCRLPKRKWWPNLSRIKLTAAHRFRPFAPLITVLHEMAWFGGRDDRTGLDEALRIFRNEVSNECRGIEIMLTRICAQEQ